MTRIAWPQLMRLGLLDLGLTPEVFWSLTPAELVLMAGLRANGEHLTRADLAELLARFPDAPFPMQDMKHHG